MMNFKRLLCSSLLLPALSTAAGCDLIQEPDPTPLEGGGCVEEVTVLAGIDEVSALGFSAAQVLDVAVGAHMSAMEWGEGLADGGVTVKFGPESGAAQLAVTVEYAGGEVRYVKSTPDNTEWDGGYADCSDRLEVDASVSVKSSGGALDESFVAALRASTPRIATLKQVIEHEALGGSLALTTVAPAEASVGAVNVDLGFTEDGLFGGAWSQVEVVMGEVVGATWMSYARWPGFDSPCESFEAPLALTSAAAGFSGADMLALVASAGPLEIQWQGAPSSSLALTLVHDGAAVCASHEGEGAGALRLGAIASVMTGDGRWMGSFPVQVSGEPGARGAAAGEFWPLRALRRVRAGERVRGDVRATRGGPERLRRGFDRLRWGGGADRGRRDGERGAGGARGERALVPGRRERLRGQRVQGARGRDLGVDLSGLDRS
jgi:hypothetical protein